MGLTRFVIALLFVVVNVAWCRLRHSRAGFTTFPSRLDSQHHESIQEVNQNSIKNCTPPDQFPAGIKAKGIALLAISAMHSVYAMEDDGPDMSILVFDCAMEKQLLFMHIPKNAGSTISTVGNKHGVQWGWRRWPGQKQLMSDGNECSKWHVPPNLITGDNPYNSPTAEIFCVTRDPWERMLSEYIYGLSKEEEWGPYPNVHHGQPCSIDGFNKFVQHSIAEMSLGHPYVSDCHLVPQWNYIRSSDGHEWCKHRLPISNLTDEFNRLMSSYGLDLRMEPHEKENSASYCPDLDSQRHHDLSSVFYAETKAAMRSFYATDFANLGDTLPDFYATDFRGFP